MSLKLWRLKGNETAFLALPCLSSLTLELAP